MRDLRGFTLLEVLVAVSILGLGLTVILSSQASLFATANRSEKISVATSLARCRMSETEVDLLKLGYPLADESHDGDCCGDDSEEGFSCSWKIERVKLPEASLTEDMDGGLAESDDMGALGALSGLSQSSGEGIAPGGDLSAMAESLGAGTSSAGIAQMAMSMVYPALKPMLEASIRKVTVTVEWKEGSSEKTLSVVQYVTDPRQGEIDPNLDTGTGVSGTGTGTGTSTGTSTGAGTSTGTGTGTGLGAGNPFGRFMGGGK
jgi:general secretion pathway protein I